MGSVAGRGGPRKRYPAWKVRGNLSRLRTLQEREGELSPDEGRELASLRAWAAEHEAARAASDA
jgi:hypothetical protein